MKFKHIFLVTIFIVISNFSFAQVWSLNELIELVNMNEDDADTYITGKGYALVETTHFEKVEEMSYAYKKSSSTFATNWLSYISGKDINVYKTKIFWQMTGLDVYNNFKIQIKSNGFTFTGKEAEQNGSTTFSYKKDKYFIDLEIIETEGKEGEKFNQYVISLFLY